MKAFILTLALCFVMSCGQAPQGNTNPQKPTDGKATLMVFSAPYCPVCKKEVPTFKDEIASKLSADQVSKVHFQIWVTAGDDPEEKPSQDIANNYLAHLALPNFNVNVDPWRCKNYKQQFGDPGCILPAAVVINADGTTQTFPAGPTSFVPSKIVDYLKATVK